MVCNQILVLHQQGSQSPTLGKGKWDLKGNKIYHAISNVIFLLFRVQMEEAQKFTRN